MNPSTVYFFDVIKNLFFFFITEAITFVMGD